MPDKGLLGLVVNPVAGLGGPAGLKGSDGAAIQQQARARGSEPRAGIRAAAALAVLAGQDASRVPPAGTLLTAAGEMGERSALAAGLTPQVVYRSGAAKTSGEDTAAAAAALVDWGAGLVLFAGGDGTARDVARGVAGRVPILGIPAGVKMYSGCFGVSPRAAGALAAAWLRGEVAASAEREILDVDEEQVRTGRVEPRLYALVQVPIQVGRSQGSKIPTAGERDAVTAAAQGVAATLEPGVTYLLGPGGTTAQVARTLGVAATPLGVDAIRDGALIKADATEAELYEIAGQGPARAIVSVIGGQGFLLGRGNQQLSARVIGRLTPPPLVVVATATKLAGLGGQPLLVDTGDPAVDRTLAGHVRVITGPTDWAMYAVAAPED